MTFNTGNNVPSTDPRDLYDNAENLDKLVNGVDPFYADRKGVLRESWAGMENTFDTSQAGRENAFALSQADKESRFQAFLVSSGYVSKGNYAAGVVLAERNEYVAVNAATTGTSPGLYRPNASAMLPLTLTGAWATDSGGLVLLGDDVLRQELAQPAGATMLGFAAAAAQAAAKTVETKLRELVDRSDFTSDAAFNANKSGKLSRDASGRLRTQSFVAGTEELSGAATRDAFVAGRNVTGATDCHAFADRTVMSGVTDAGTYGSFDCTVKLDGSNTQNHVFSFQDRVEYRGSGILQNSAGFYSRMQHSGSGSILKRIGVDVAGVEVTAGGSVTEQIGVLVRDLVAGTAKVGLNIEQSAGFAIYANGGARSFHKGSFRVGVDDASSVPFSVGAPSSPSMFLNPVAGAGIVGVSGDNAWRLQTNSGTRLEVLASSNGYTVRPGADNSQPLGDVTRRWSQLFAGTATISTSDAREKTEVRTLSGAEIAAAKDLAKEIGVFRFLAAVEEKGDAAREHIGMTVQRAIEVMKAHGLDPFAYSFICYDEWEDQYTHHAAVYEQIFVPAIYEMVQIPDIFDEAGNLLQEARFIEGVKLEESYHKQGELISEAWDELVTPAGNRYSFRFEGLLAFIAAGFEARLSALEFSV